MQSTIWYKFHKSALCSTFKGGSVPSLGHNDPIDYSPHYHYHHYYHHFYNNFSSSPPSGRGGRTLSRLRKVYWRKHKSNRGGWVFDHRDNDDDGDNDDNYDECDDYGDQQHENNQMAPKQGVPVEEAKPKPWTRIEAWKFIKLSWKGVRIIIVIKSITIMGTRTIISIIMSIIKNMSSMTAIPSDNNSDQVTKKSKSVRITSLWSATGLFLRQHYLLSHCHLVFSSE